MQFSKVILIMYADIKLSTLFLGLFILGELIFLFCEKNYFLPM